MSYRAVFGSPPVLIALALGLALRILLALQTPVGGPSIPGRLSSYNDELAHANYAFYVLQHGSLPPQLESIQGQGALERGNYENYQPPLYYWLVASVGRLIGANDIASLVILARIFGIAISAGLIFVFIDIARSLGLDSRFAAGGIIFLALSGVFVQFTTMLSNESLFWLFAGAMILLTLRMWDDGVRTAHWMMFAAIACLAIYTKLTAVLLLPLPLLLLAKHPKPRLAVSIAGMLCLVLVCVFPLWLRNFYGFGSLLPLNAGFGDPTWRLPNLTTAIYAARSIVFPWSEFWRGFLGLLFLLPFYIYTVWAMVFRSGWRTLVSRPVAFAAFAIAVVSFVWLNTRYDQAEGRYLFTAWPPLQVALIGEPSTDAHLWLLFVVLLLPYGLFMLPLAGI